MLTAEQKKRMNGGAGNDQSSPGHRASVLLPNDQLDQMHMGINEAPHTEAPQTIEPLQPLAHQQQHYQLQ